MRHLTLHEYERLYRGSADTRTGTRRGGRLFLSDYHFRRLRSYDESRATSSGRQILDWNHRYATAQQWVGVVRIPGLSLEILPKAAPRHNLLYMLMTAGELPFRERDLAAQATENAPLLEVLVRLFAGRLFGELTLGRQHSYVQRRDNLPYIKGKLLIGRHLAQNLARPDRFHVEYDEFCADTPLNRIFKAACRRLVAMTTKMPLQERLTDCLFLLDDVRDVIPTPSDFDRIIINRQNERFADLFQFARLILLEQAPTSHGGDTKTFSLLFDMNAVFEKFIAQFLRHHILTNELSDCRLYDQARSRLEHLVYRPPPVLPANYRPRRHGSKVLPLKADLLIERGPHRLIIDTKWKVLSSEAGGRRGVSRNDLLQLFAYAQNYGARNNVLLYPHPGEDLDAQVFNLPLSGDGGDLQRIQVRFADLRANLWTQRNALTRSLTSMVRKALPEASQAPSREMAPHPN